MIIEMDGLSIQVSRKKIKNMYLRIHATTGEINISAPLKLSSAAIHDFLILKRHWIHQSRTRVIDRSRQETPSFQNDELHYFLGQPYVLKLHHDAPKLKIELVDQTLHCFIKSTMQAEHGLRVLNAWYKQQMLQRLPQLIQTWEPIIGVSVSSWGVRSMNTRWGSCSIKTRRISLNLKLIQKPIECLEYVLVHEMVHLHEANHSPRFYALMDQFMPTWRDIKLKLDHRMI